MTIKRFIWSIIAFVPLTVISAQDFTKEVTCGSRVSFKAEAFDGFVFATWSDGVREPSRTIEVFSDTTIIAIFQDKCGDFADLPLVNRYDWILMLNVKKIYTEMHYTLTSDRVRWYRVVGQPDQLEYPIEGDPEDYYLGEGFSFTLDQNLERSGTYYAWVDLNLPQGAQCSGLWRTQLISFVSASSAAREVKLLPNATHPNGIMQLVGLNPDILTDIRIYSVTGQLLMQTSTIGAENYLLHAYPATGVFEVQVLSEQDNVVLRYLVKQ